jgi:hypothetical protein
MKTAASLLAIFTMAAIAQQDTNTRQLWNTEFLKKRPAAATPAKPAVQPNYKPLAQSTPTAPVGTGIMLGITPWRVRDPKPSDTPGTRVLVLKKKDDQKERTQERIDCDAPITQEDSYRFTFEMPATGYLYVIDRERYADGKLSVPYLIYPNNAGDNVVVPGRVIEIPDRREIPNAFTIEAKPGQVAEVLSFLVTPEPIPGLRLSHDPVPLDPALYASWEKKAVTKSERYEMVGGAGQNITPAENNAGADRTQQLTQDDALPQMLYRVTAKPGTPVLIEIPLKFK